MKKTGVIIALLTLASILLYGCGTSSSKANASNIVSDNASQTESQDIAAEKEYFVKQAFESKALQGSVVPQETNQTVYVLLPPSYYDSDKAYPVVYFLHGYDESPSSFIHFAKGEFNTAFKAGAKEFILVGVNGDNALGGGFFANSDISGNWEDCIVNEVVPLIDDNFRTMKDSNSRGISGFSMGGYGAYSIALRHPDVFSALLTMSPGLIADGEMESAFQSWDGFGDFKVAYAQAFSPNKDVPDTLGNIPEFSGTPEDNQIVADWESGYGDINGRVDAYASLNTSLKAIKIMYGTNDSYEWIPRGCEFLAKTLQEKNIDFTLDAEEYGHSTHIEVVGKYMIPFFNENLTY